MEADTPSGLSPSSVNELNDILARGGAPKPPAVPPQSPVPPADVKTAIAEVVAGQPPAAPVQEPPVAPVQEPSDGLGLPADIFQNESPPEDPKEPPQGDEEHDDAVPADVEKQGDRAVASWKHKNQQIKELKAQLHERDARLAGKDSERDAAMKDIQARLDQALAERNEFEDKLGRRDITEQRSFKEAYDSKLDKLYSHAVAQLVRAGVEAKEAQGIVRSLSAPGTSFDDLNTQLSRFPSVVQSVVANDLDAMWTLQEARGKAVENWKSQMELYRAEEGKHAIAQDAQQIELGITAAVSELANEGSFLLRESASDAQFNEKRRALIDVARGVMQQGDHGKIAKYVLGGVTADLYRRLFIARDADFRKAVTELNAIKNARPGIGRGAPPALAGAASVEKSKPQSIGSFLDARLPA